MNKIIEVKGLSKEYNTFSMKNVTFSIEYGKIAGLIGQNGNGKTTIIKCLLNLTSFYGDIKVFNKSNVKYEKEIKEDIGIVFDELPFDECLNAYKISKIMKSIYKNWSKETFKIYLDRFKLPDNQKIKEYSRGMKTKLMLAVALSHEAKLLILDEPTSGLDPVFRKEILDVLNQFVADGNKSVLFSTHITGDLEQIADDIIFVNNGELIYNGSKDRMMELHLKHGNNNSDSIDEIMIELIKKGEKCRE